MIDFFSRKNVVGKEEEEKDAIDLERDAHKERRAKAKQGALNRQRAKKQQIVGGFRKQSPKNASNQNSSSNTDSPLYGPARGSEQDVLPITEEDHHRAPFGKGNNERYEGAGVFDPTLTAARPVQQPGFTDRHLHIPDVKAFACQPVPPGEILRCSVVRGSKGLQGKFFPYFNMSVEQGKTHLMSACKRSLNKTPNYIISTGTLSTDSRGFLGKLRSNFVGSEFTLYDTGRNPFTRREWGLRGAREVRRELAFVHFKAGKGMHLQAVIPSLYHDGTPIKIQPFSKQEVLSSRFKSRDLQGLELMSSLGPAQANLHNQPNFAGRKASMRISVHNMQITLADDPDRVVAQFGRLGPEKFFIDLHHPFTPFQAFGIFLANMDLKLWGG